MSLVSQVCEMWMIAILKRDSPASAILTKTIQFNKMGKPQMKITRSSRWITKPYCAKLMGLDQRWGLCRLFVKPTYGAYGDDEYNWDIGNGIYEIRGGKTIGRSGDKTYLRIDGNQCEELTLEEVKQHFRTPTPAATPETTETCIACTYRDTGEDDHAYDPECKECRNASVQGRRRESYAEE
jgi:hypothetical protein